MSRFADSDDDYLELSPRPRKRKSSKAVKGASYTFGVVFLLVGIGLLVWFSYTQRAPAKLFNLLAAGGITALLSGVGLFIHPLDQERLHIFRNEPNPLAVYRAMPTFWKVWLLVTLTA